MSKSDTGESVTYENQNTKTSGALSDVPSAQRAKALRGAQILAKSLKAEGVDVLFGYPGGANLEIFDVLSQYGIQCIRTEHEQGAVHAAQGFARATSRPGVCLATSGPGATNLVTGIADANSDSTPIVAITGNVPTHLLGRNAFQEVDIVSITKPITKKNYLVKHVRQIPGVVREAFELARGRRPGPVLIDIPKDIQQHYPLKPNGDYAEPIIPAEIDAPEPDIESLSDNQLEIICSMLEDSSRPIIYAGGGIISADCSNELVRVAELLQIPVTNTIMAHGAFPPKHPLALHVLGMHGSKYANAAINEADLVLALGVRFDDRVTGNVDKFIANGKIIHIDLDPQELNKNKTVTLPICADVKISLQQIEAAAKKNTSTKWVEYVAALRQTHPFKVPDNPSTTAQYAIDLLSEKTNGEAIVSLGVGQHQMWAMQFYQSTSPHSFFSSSGFGTMGYGLPAAIGAKTGQPDKLVIDIDGDGSLNMTIHELATCYRFGIGVKVVVINNQWLGMVRQWQDMIYDKNRSSTDLSDPHLDAPLPDSERDIYPDFVKIANGYGVAAERNVDKEDLANAFDRMLADPNQPYLLDIIVEREDNVYPMIPAGASYQDIIMCEEDLKKGETICKVPAFNYAAQTNRAMCKTYIKVNSPGQAGT